MPSSSSNNSKAPMANKEIEKLVNKYSSSSTRRSSSSRLNASVPNFNFHLTNNNESNNTNDLLMSASSSNVFNNSNDPLQYVAGRRQNSRRRSSRNLQQQQLTTNTATSNNKTPLRHSNSATEDSVTTSTTGRTTPTRASVSSSFLENTSTAAHPSLAPDWATSNYATNKYIHRPASFEEEQDALLLQLESPSQSASADDPLAAANNNMGFVMTDDDKFEDEMLDEIEMTRDRCANFVNLGDMEAAGHIQRRRRRQRFLVLTVCCLVLVGVILAIVFAVQLTQKNKHPKQRQVVPFASKRLKLLCAEALDLGPGQSATFPLQVPKDCEVACLQAECCWNPNSIYQCTPETQQYCDIYQASCTIMLPDNPDYSHDDGQSAGSSSSGTTITPTHVVPGAPATLKTTCVPVGSSLSVTQVCHDVCALGDCCWNTTSTMTCTADSQQRNCPPYKEYCSVLNTHSPQSNTNTNTNGGGTKAPFPAASSDLPTICAISTMEQNGARLCQEQCAQAECCWKVGTVNCASSVPNQMCQAYSNACAVLNNLNSALPNHNGGTSTTTTPPLTTASSSSEMPFPPAPEGLSVYCDPGEMEEISLRTCQEKCSPAECCWSTKEGVSDCPASVSPEVCQPYAQACAILNDLVTFPGGSGEPTSNNNNVPVAPGDLAQRCAKDNIIGSENGGDLLIECERECLAASCCWQPNADTPCTNNDRCTAYTEPCSIFVGLFGGSSSGSTTTTTTATTTSNGVPEAPSDLATTCSPDVLKTSVNNGEYIVKCEKECLAAACCWKESASNPCPGADGCEPYMEPCGKNLIAALEALEGQTGAGSGTTTVTDSPSSANSEQAQEIAKACNDKVAFFVKPRCENACSPGACCFEDTTACSAGVDCDIFAPCSVLDRRMLRH